MNLIKRAISNPYSLRYLAYKRWDKRAGNYQRDHYYYCIRKATEDAQALGVNRISIIEFGVAGGNGLLEIERICASLSSKGPVAFEIYGFDTGAGLPPPLDYRDFPYQWQEGFFAMDVNLLKSRLTSAKLVVGNVEDTVPAFNAEGTHAPIGAIMFDLDYYSSTVDALRIFEGDPRASYLPRVRCYFDDIEGISSAGVSLAIDEFNSANETRKIENPLLLRHGREYRDWGWKVYEFHDFEHPDYARPLISNSQLPLR